MRRKNGQLLPRRYEKHNQQGGRQTGGKHAGRAPQRNRKPAFFMQNDGRHALDHRPAQQLFLMQQIHGLFFKDRLFMHGFDELDLLVQVQFVVDITAYQIILHFSPVFIIFLSLRRERCTRTLTLPSLVPVMRAISR